MKVKHPSGLTWELEEFITYLESLIPDLKESGRNSIAEDFEVAVAFLRKKKAL